MNDENDNDIDLDDEDEPKGVGGNLGAFLGNPVEAKANQNRILDKMSDETKESLSKATPLEIEGAKKDAIAVAKLGREALKVLTVKVLREKKILDHKLKGGGQAVTTGTHKNSDDVTMDELRVFAEIYNKISAKVLDANKVILGLKDKEPPKAKENEDDKDVAEWIKALGKGKGN